MLDSSNSRSSAPATLPATSPLLLLSSSRHYQHRQRPRDPSLNGVAKNRSQSAGSNWEAEFAQYSDAEQSRKASQHLELTWKVHKVPCLPQKAGCDGQADCPRKRKWEGFLVIFSVAECKACPMQPL